MSERDEAADGADRTAAREEALWRSIVANYGERATLDPEPGTEAGDDAGRDASPELGAPRQRPPGRPAADRGDDADDVDRERDVLDAWDDPEDRFVPPTPPPLPRPEPPRLLAWVGVIGVPVLTVLLVVLHVRLASWASLLALCWFVGGFGYLVATMRRDDDDDEWDDGAVL